MPVIPEPYAPAAAELGIPQERAARPPARDAGAPAAAPRGRDPLPPPRRLQRQRHGRLEGPRRADHGAGHADGVVPRHLALLPAAHLCRLALLGLHDGPRPLQGGVRRDPRLDRRRHRHRRTAPRSTPPPSSRRSACCTSPRSTGTGNASTRACERTALDSTALAELYERARGSCPAASTRRCGRCARSAATRSSSPRARAAIIRDVDGNEYVDWVCSWGPLILGHAHPDVVAAVTEAAGARHQLRRADRGRGRARRARSPTASRRSQMLRMTSSGTEATMSALRLARAVTGREQVLKFAGAYHGHVDGLLAEAGSGLATQGIPASPGVPGGGRGRHRDRALERPRGAARGGRPPRPGGDPRRAGAGQHGRRAAPARLSGAAAREPPTQTARC